MQRLNSSVVGIDQGNVLMFSDFQDGGEMWTGKGRREARHAVRFAEPFVAPPTVIVGLTMWDTDAKTNQRADIVAENVATDGFDLVFRTWADTRIARVRADWTAIGALRDADMWQL